MWWRVLSACAVMSAGVASVGGCDSNAIDAVGAPGGVYRPDQGCTLTEGAPRCPREGEALPELRFETAGNPGVSADAAQATLSNLRVSCRRSFCGTGSLAAHAALQWTADPGFRQRAASFSYPFGVTRDLGATRDLIGRTVSFAVYVEELAVPMHAQIGVIYEFWRWVAWAPLVRGWNHISGVVSPANPLTKIDPGVTAIPVTALQIDVYVPVRTAAGETGSWSGEIYLDDIGWQ